MTLPILAADVAAQLHRFITSPPTDRPETVVVHPMAEVAAALDLEQGLREGLGPTGVTAFVGRYLVHATRLHSGGFFAHQTAAPNAGSAIAALIDGAVSNPMAIYEMGPAAATIEYWLLGRLLGWVGWKPPPWPSERDDTQHYGAGVLVHGGSVGTLTALVAARTRVQPDVWSRGNDPRLAIVCAASAHYAVNRAAGIMGLGAAQIVHAPCDARGALTAVGVHTVLESLKAEGRLVIAVVATGCSTAVGVFDPIAQIADVCTDFGVWLHIDAAHGGAVLISAVLRSKLQGIERADSVVWDAHKMMRTGPLCTAVLFRDEHACNAAFEQEASYLFHDKAQPGFDFLHRTIECTKAALSLKWYLALAWEGEAAVARYIEQCFALTERAWQRLQGDADFDVALQPEANILCFRPRWAVGQELALRDQLIREGRFHLSTTEFAGQRWLRIVVISPHSDDATIEALIERLRKPG